jgi:hypothetical protein
MREATISTTTIRTLTRTSTPAARARYVHSIPAPFHERVGNPPPGATGRAPPPGSGHHTWSGRAARGVLGPAGDSHPALLGGRDGVQPPHAGHVLQLVLAAIPRTRSRSPRRGHARSPSRGPPLVGNRSAWRYALASEADSAESWERVDHRRDRDHPSRATVGPQPSSVKADRRSGRSSRNRPSGRSPSA